MSKVLITKKQPRQEELHINQTVSKRVDIKVYQTQQGVDGTKLLSSVRINGAVATLHLPPEFIKAIGDVNTANITIYTSVREYDTIHTD